MAEPIIIYTGEPISTVILTALAIVFGDLFDFAALFGFGPTRIEKQKKKIKAFFKPIFATIHNELDWHIHQYTFLAYKSWQVRERLEWRPDLAQYVEQFNGYLEELGRGFGLGHLDTGERQRIVNQYIANASESAWTIIQMRDLFRAVIVAEYKRQNKPIPTGLLPPPVDDPPYRGWTETQLDDFNWLIEDFHKEVHATEWILSGFYISYQLTPIGTRLEQIPIWPQPRTGLSWDGTKWFETDQNPSLIVADEWLYYLGRQVTWDSWKIAKDEGPSKLIYRGPQSYTEPNDPRPPSPPLAPRYRCVSGVCKVDSTGPFGTLTECQAQCKDEPPPPSDSCPLKCKDLISAVRDMVVRLNAYVNETVFPLAKSALQLGEQNRQKITDLRNRHFDLLRRFNDLFKYVFDTVGPWLRRLEAMIKRERQDRINADRVINQRIDLVIADFDREIRQLIKAFTDLLNALHKHVDGKISEAEKRAIRDAIIAVATALPRYLSPGNLAWWLSQYPPSKHKLHGKVKDAVAEQMAKEETYPDSAKVLLERDPAEEIPVIR